MVLGVLGWRLKVFSFIFFFSRVCIYIGSVYKYVVSILGYGKEFLFLFSHLISE